MTIKPLTKKGAGDLAAKAKAAAQKPSVATRDEQDVPTSWDDGKAASKKPGTRFNKVFSTKADPEVLKRFDAIVEAKGMKKAAAFEQALELWIAENR